ncbi:hypothetical protein MKR81_06855 [Vibrio campbellii]|uniref:hypothetical protein n=1 Tax=Vibrio campbellii TaxID=680 RepID=UPI001F0787FA|nr:hypothetical protein [Vibrio campbellii]UMM04313.1 hypothetical protein MKR81_06855 [Vibrio campbellii]
MNNLHNKAFKSDSQRLAFSLRSSIAKRRSHLNAALCVKEEISMSVQNYRFQAVKNFADMMLYILISFVLCLFTFFYRILSNSPVLGKLFEVYQGLEIHHWVEIILFIGFVMLAVVSALLMVNNILIHKSTRQG